MMNLFMSIIKYVKFVGMILAREQALLRMLLIIILKQDIHLNLKEYKSELIIMMQ